MTSRWKDSVSTTSKSRISKKAIFALVFYLIVPIVAISMIISAYPELSKDRLIGMLVRTIPIGIMLVLISQFGVRYEKGDVRRFVLSEIYVLLVLLWLFVLLGGEPVIHQTWGEYHFSLNIWNYLILIFIVMSVNALYYLFEYRAYHSKDVVDEAIEEKEEVDEEAVEPRGVVVTAAEAD